MPQVSHEHVPLYRVIRSGWTDPLDTTFSRQRSNRWNTAGGMAVLYTSCSEAVARAIVVDIFKTSALMIDDLRHEIRPALIELDWRGNAVDLASAAGIVECGFPLNYPDGVDYPWTQQFAIAWHGLGAEAVLCRSASMWRTGHRGWMGSHEQWSELGIFVENARVQPIVSQRRVDLDWMREPVRD